MEVDERLRKDLDRLNYANGGRIRALADKITTIDNPILIVGLGGTGVDAVLRTKKLIAERMVCEEGMDKPENVDYLVIDTDEKAIESSYMGTVFTNDEKFLYRTGEIRSVVDDRDRNMREDIKEWFNPKIDSSLIIHGAGAIRQVGRFILFQNVAQLKNQITAKFNRIKNGDNSIVYMFVFSGISGGTGSGAFIDMGYILKSIAESCQIRQITRLLFAFMPDVNLQHSGTTGPAANIIKRNGFAALKELDYLNNLRAHGTKYTVNYGADVAVDETAPPYETTLLFSATDVNGVSVDYDRSMAVASETVVNFIANEVAGDGTDYSIKSFLSNITTLTHAYKDSLGSAKHAVNYKYIIAGASSSYIPLDDLVSFMTYRIFDKMSDNWSKDVMQNEVNEILKHFGSVMESVKPRLSRAANAKPMLDLHDYDFNAFKENNTGILRDCRRRFDDQIALIDKEADAIVKEIIDKIDNPNNIIDQNYFLNIEYGPVVTQKMIHNDSGHPCLTNALTNEMNKCMDSKRQLGSDRELQAASKIKNASLISDKKALLKDHIDSIQTYYAALLNNYICDAMYNAFYKIQKFIITKNENVYDKVTTIMEELHRVMDNYSSIDNRAKEIQGDEIASHVFSWNMIDAPEFIDSIEKMMDKDSNLMLDVNEAIIKFYSDFLHNSDKWTSVENRNSIVNRLNEFVSSLFSDIIAKTIDTYIESIATQKGKTVTEYYEEIHKRLVAESAYMFRKKAGASPGTSFSYMSIPRDCSSMYEFFKNAASSENDILKQSFIKNKIFRINFNACNCLEDYAYMEEYETAYEINGRGTPGTHLFEKTPDGGNIDWSNIPSPCPSSTWTNIHRKEMEINDGEKVRADKYFEIFDKALENGLIYSDKEQRGDHIVLVYPEEATQVNLDDILKECGIGNIDSGFITTVDAQKAINKLDKAMFVNEDGSFDIDSFETVDLNAEERLNSTDMTKVINYTKEYFYKNIAIRDRVGAELVRFEKYKSYRNKLLAFTDSGVDNFTRLLNILSTRIIKKNKSMFVYNDRLNTKQPIMNMLTDCKDIYGYFVLFNKFVALPDEVGRYLDEKANKIIANPTDEQFEDMLDWLTRFKEKLGEESASLEENRHSVMNYEDKRAFYAQFKSKLNDRLTLLMGVSSNSDDDDDDDDDDM
ncbi:MAG TPA: hypothetical protein DCG28_04350 [Lachnospiraceae bacterium]|nr:hypothetical protein [Lachnospiraceae bacterium]